ncbi:MAG: prepilin-type N-terminal cleavage/methylation domain-containing protein [Phycisphaerales bacterium]|nr:prepilin-type N-terminal cleavage/methylation domain-containing protein [Phycisphaerales bacterium]
MKRHHNRTRSAGFTLIELLVVIAIIALLIGILLPALGAARESAKKLKCLTQVRAMGQAFTFYADDNRDWYPIIPTNPSVYPNTQFLDGQFTAGGVSGLFSTFQVGDGEASISGGTVSGDVGYFGQFGAPGTYYGGEDTPLMRGYLDGLEILTCPSDRIDYYWSRFPTNVRHNIAQADNQKTPEPPASERDVIHYNVSYLYIAGLKSIDPSIQFSPPLWGDETNTGDISVHAWYGWDWINNMPGSGQGSEPNPKDEYGFNPQTGYARDDNHGDEGGNFVRADGSADFVTTNPQATFFMDAEDIENEDLRTSNLSINLIKSDRSNKVQVID